MGNLKEWFSASELAGVQGLPNTPQGINKRARTQNWQKRNKDGVQGGAVEYHYSSLPENVQQALGFTFVVNNDPRKSEDYAFIKPSGGKIGVEVSAQGLTREEVASALQVIEQALANAGKPQPKQDDGLNNTERHLIRCFRASNEQGRVAILNIAETMADMQKEEEAGQSFETAEIA